MTINQVSYDYYLKRGDKEYDHYEIDNELPILILRYLSKFMGEHNNKFLGFVNKKRKLKQDLFDDEKTYQMKLINGNETQYVPNYGTHLAEYNGRQIEIIHEHHE